MGPRVADGNIATRLPAWQDRILDPGIAREPSADGHGFALWIPSGRNRDFHLWERISSVPHTEFTLEPGVGATAATSVQAKQSIKSVWGKLWQRFRTRSEGRTWVLLNGETADQCGERRNDLLLVWSEGEAACLDQAWIKSRWPASGEARRIGPSLFVVFGVTPPDAGSTATQAEAEVCPQKLAKRIVAEGRQAGDRRREIAALTDLGLALLHAGNVVRALAVLEEALGLARQWGDPAEQAEVSDQVALALLRDGQASRALPLLERCLISTREAGDRFAEKIVLEHQAFAYVQLGHAARAVACFEEALHLARAVNHRKHEADLLWYLAIQHAELGRRDEAIAHAQSAIDLMWQTQNPQAAWFAEHLRKYRAGEAGNWLAGGHEPGFDMPPALRNGSISAGSWSATSAGPQSASGPGWLCMALSAAKSMARFIGSGFKTVPPHTLQRRLRTCAACPHHTGLRCKLCGCFTHAKARMTHEECPIGKWST